MTTALCDWLVASLKRLRVKSECTSFDLQRLMAKEKGLVMWASSIRRALNDAGYKYLPSSKKPIYNEEQRRQRVAFAKKFADKSLAELKQEVNMCMDGVVFTVPPPEAVARQRVQAVPKSPNMAQGPAPTLWGTFSEEKSKILGSTGGFALLNATIVM